MNLEQAPSLSLAQALALMQAHHPGLQACRQDAAIVLAQRRQQTRLSQPGLELGLEDLGTAADQNFQQWTLSLSQALPLTDRPGLLARLATLEASAAEADCQQQSRELGLRLAAVYFEGLYWQERLALAHRQQGDAEASLRLIERQILAGKLSPLERTPPAQELARRKLDQELAESRLKARLQALAAFWPSRSLPATQLSWPAGSGLSADSPLLRQRQLQEAIAALETAEAEAEAWPDIRLGSGLRWHPQSSEFGINLQLGWDLPLWHQQQDAIQAARLKQIRQGLVSEQTRLNLDGRRSQLCLQAGELARQLRAYEQDLLPRASGYAAQIRRGLEAGKFGSLSLLQARQQLAGLELELLQWRIEAAATAYELSGLGGCEQP